MTKFAEDRVHVIFRAHREGWGVDVVKYGDGPTSASVSAPAEGYAYMTPEELDAFAVVLNTAARALRASGEPEALADPLTDPPADVVGS